MILTFLDDSNGASKLSPTEPLYLDFLSGSKAVITTVSLSKCDQLLTGIIKYPKEEITYMKLRGQDSLGNSFEYTTKEPRSLSFVGPSRLRLETTKPVQVTVPVTKTETFSFILLADSDGLFNVNVSFSSTSSHLVLTPLQGARVVLNRNARVSVSVLVQQSAPLNATISFIVNVTYLKNCDVGASYTQSIFVPPNVRTVQSYKSVLLIQHISSQEGPSDKCGGCKNGATCSLVLGKYRCKCASGYIGIYCQTSRFIRFSISTNVICCSFQTFLRTLMSTETRRVNFIK